MITSTFSKPNHYITSCPSPYHCTTRALLNFILRVLQSPFIDCLNMDQQCPSSDYKGVHSFPGMPHPLVWSLWFVASTALRSAYTARGLWYGRVQGMAWNFHVSSSFAWASPGAILVATLPLYAWPARPTVLATRAWTMHTTLGRGRRRPFKVFEMAQGQPYNDDARKEEEDHCVSVCWPTTNVCATVVFGIPKGFYQNVSFSFLAQKAVLMPCQL